MIFSRVSSISLLLFCLFLGFSQVHADYGFAIDFLSDPLQRVSGGKTANFTVRVTNTSDKDLDCVAKVWVPDELGASTPDPLHFNLLSSRYSTQQVSIYIPKAISRGRYNLSYSVESNDNPIYSANIGFVIEVTR